MRGPSSVSRWRREADSGEHAQGQLPRFVEEVEQVRQALRLDRTNFYLLGRSWDGILAMEHAPTSGRTR